MAKVLLIQCYGSKSKINDEQGIASIAHFLRINNHEVEMKSAFVDSDINALVDFSPEIVGISAYHDDLHIANQIAKFYKEFNKNILICLGGYSATYYYFDILKEYRFIDVIVRGEGEITFNSLCVSFDKKISYNNILGLVYKNEKNEIIVNPQRAPIENMDDFIKGTSKDIFISNNIKAGQISSSRGCFGNCSFCYSHKFFDPLSGKKWRGRSVESIISEIRNNYDKYGINRFFFNDASFEDSFEGLDRVKKISELLIKEQLPISFCVNFRTMIYKRMNSELIDSLKQAGLCGVFLGIEAFNEEDLVLYNKNTTVHDNEAAIKYFIDNEISINIGFINFNPYSNLNTLKQNAHLLNKYTQMGSFVVSTKLRAYKGTNIYNKIKNDKLLLTDDLFSYYCYSYVNSSVKSFENFITDFINRINSENNNLFQKIGDYYMVYPQIISHYKIISMKLQINVEDLFIRIYDKYKCILNQHNHIIYSWYQELLLLLSSKWDEDMAKCITDKTNVVKESIKTLHDLTIMAMDLNKSLLKADKRFHKFLVN